MKNILVIVADRMVGSYIVKLLYAGGKNIDIYYELTMNIERYSF